MEAKERYFYLEYICTFLIFLPLLFLFPIEVAPLRIFLAGGIIIGACAAYISRDRIYLFRRFATLAISLLILLGAAYAVLKSTFLYREVIIICIKSLSLLIVLNSFSSFSPGYLSSMQVFSILMFFCICALTKEYSRIFLVSASGFLLGLLMLAKAKFYILFDASERIKKVQPGSKAFFVLALALISLFSWALFLNVPLGKIRTLGYLKEDDTGFMEEEEKDKGASVPDEEIQRELTNLTFKLSSTDEMHYALAAIQDLMAKGEPYAYEAEKAEKNVLKMVNNPVLVQSQGQEKINELNNAVGQYVKNKISKNLIQIKGEMNNAVEDSRVGLWQRFTVLSSVNKLEYSNSFSAMDKYGEQLKSSIGDSSLPDKTKEQLRQFARQMKEWKAYQLYSKKLSSFKNKIGALDEIRGRDFGNLSQQISDVDTISGSSSADKLIGQMRQQALPEDDKLLRDAEELLKLKKVMLVSKESGQLRKRLEDSGQNMDEPPELESALNAVEESRDWQEIAEKISKLLERLREGDYPQIPKEVKDILGMKLEDLIKESTDSLKEQIRESKLPDSGAELLQQLEKMDSESGKEEIESAADAMEESLEKLSKQGSITEESKDAMVEESGKLEQLLVTKAELDDIDNDDLHPGKQETLDYKEEIDKLLKEVSLKSEEEEQIEKLMDKLASAKTVSQVDDVLEAASRQIEEMAKKEDAVKVEKIKELMQDAAKIKKMFVLEKDSQDLRDEIESLKNALPQQASLLEKKLDEVRESKDREELLDTTKALREVTETKQFEKQFKASESLDVSKNSGQQEQLKIDLLPDYAVISVKSTVLLKSITICDNFIKDVSPELEWFSSDPSVASVDQNGRVYSKSTGETEITCRYRGTVSKKCRIAVVEALPGVEVAAIDREMSR